MDLHSLISCIPISIIFLHRNVTFFKVIVTVFFIFAAYYEVVKNKWQNVNRPTNNKRNFMNQNFSGNFSSDSPKKFPPVCLWFLYSGWFNCLSANPKKWSNTLNNSSATGDKLFECL